MNVQQRFLGAVSLVILGLSLVATPVALGSEPGQIAVAQVSQDNYYDLMDTWLFTHVGDNRGPSGPDLIPCRDNIAFLMESYGLSVELEPFSYGGGTYHNVVGTKLGTVYPDQEYIVGAHYDSVSNPGADDNASGVALVLECARVLGQYDSEYTIRFVAFSMEEVGLVGSDRYVDAHFADDILGMISADMVAYDPATNTCNVYGRSASDPIKTTLADAINEYGDGLIPLIGGDTPYSDHAPFEQAGFQACLLIEGAVWDNPWYHTQQDSFEQPGNLNFPYATKMTRSICGWLVDQANVIVDPDYLQFAFPTGFPEYCLPTGGTAVRVHITGVGGLVLDPSTALLHYNTGSGWQTSPLVVVGINLFDGILPPAACGSLVEYHFSAETTGGELFLSPYAAPDVAYSATAAFGEILLFEDNFESDTGWTTEILGATSGWWQRGVPVDDDGWDYDPAEDSDGSGKAWLTQNEYGNTDVDNGAVRLISPVIDISAPGASIGYDYYLYLTNTTGAVDMLLVELNTTGGMGTWTEVARHTTNGGLQWRSHVITSEDLADAGITPSAATVLRFTTNDADEQSINESGLDAFWVGTLDCGGPFPPGDLNCDGFIDFADINPFVLAVTGQAAYETAYPDCIWLNGDINGDGTVGFGDINPFVLLLSQP